MNPIKKYAKRWIDPVDLVTDLQGGMNRLFASSLHQRSHDGFGEFMPSLELKEDENQFILHLDIPGMERKDLDISVVGNTLTVKGERKEEESKKGKGYFYSERRYGSFQRSIELPAAVKADKVGASYKNGVLELTLPKSEKAKAKQIKVNVK
jgi:HSP20 family protein